MTERDRFLATLADTLPLPVDVRNDVVEEVAAHLSDAIADLEARGRDPEAAEAEALRQFGSPTKLGRDLARARRGSDRLLAAVGGGAWAALRTTFGMTLVAWVFAGAAAIAVLFATTVITGWLGRSSQLATDGGWNTALTALGLNIGFFYGGAAAVRGAARSGWRAPDEVRLGVTAIGTLGATCFALFVVDGPLNWASVMVLCAVPLSFAAGSRVESIRGPSWMLLALTIPVVLAAALVLRRRARPGTGDPATRGTREPTVTAWSRPGGRIQPRRPRRISSLAAGRRRRGSKR